MARSRAALLGLLLPAALIAGCEDCSKGGSSGGDGASAPEAAAASASGAVSDDGGVLNVTPLPAASVAAMVNPEKLPPYAGPTGSVEGTIKVTGDPSPPMQADFSRCPAAALTYGAKFREGPDRTLADAVVVVTGYRGFYVPEKNEAKETVIEDCAYKARTVTMTFGQRLEVKNVSNDFWTPVLEPGLNMVLMMATPKGDPSKIYPKKPGHYLLLDRDRKYSVVDVYAFLHPLHAATDAYGHYRIDGIPVGKLTVSTTHPQVDDTAEKLIDIQAGVVTKVDFVLKNVNRDAGPPSDAGPDAPYHPTLR